MDQVKVLNLDDYENSFYSATVKNKGKDKDFVHKRVNDTEMGTQMSQVVTQSEVE